MSDILLDRINDLIAPVTKAWIDAEIVTIAIDHSGFGVDSGDELVVDVRLCLKKTPSKF